MLLLLALVYLFDWLGFQTHASPLTNLLAESSNNTTSVLDTPSCLCPTIGRSTSDILWSCLATIFACSWVSIHPNIPGPNESRWRNRLDLMFWTVFGPELIINWAFRQWLGARNLEKLYKGELSSLTYTFKFLQILNYDIPTLEKGWTKTHGHFIQMGGFLLFDSEGNVAKGVLCWERFSELLKAGKIEFPKITVEEIEDRSKADGFSKMIALGQTLWFVLQCISRRAQHLDLTLIELLTLSLAVLNGFMYFLWWHKPLDVHCPVHVYLLDASNANVPNEFNETHGSRRPKSLPIFIELDHPGEFYRSLYD